jgi:hypothetical protein
LRWVKRSNGKKDERKEEVNEDNEEKVVFEGIGSNRGNGGWNGEYRTLRAQRLCSKKDGKHWRV